MPSSKFEQLDRIKAVEREFMAARFAMDELLQRAAREPAALGGAFRVRDVRTASARLEATYFIRIFAEFETSLRKFFGTLRGKTPPSRTRDLLESVGVKNRIPIDHIRRAHAVREYRNVLIHEREEAAEPIQLSQARRELCGYLSFLPANW